MPIKRKRNAIAVALLALAAGSATACGPFFPNRLLGQGDAALTAAPEGMFAEEIAVAIPTNLATFAAVMPPEDDWRRGAPYGGQTLEKDIGDLRAALRSSGVRQSVRERVVARYTAARQAHVEYLGRRDEYRDSCRLSPDPTNAPPVFEAPAVPRNLPAEFADYVAAANLYYEGEVARAQVLWRALLGRPPAERRYKSTWAAYMLGRTCMGGHPDQAIRWFRTVRELAADGFHDSLGLACASYGWEARVHLDRKDYVRAIDGYARQWAGGDWTATASLRTTANAAMSAGPEVLSALATNDLARRVLTALVLTEAAWSFQENEDWRRSAGLWLAAIEKAGVRGVGEADRLAWAAYRVGDMDRTARWLAVADPGSVLARWIGSKHLLRDGKVEQAAKQLASIVGALPVVEPAIRYNEHWNEIGIDLSDEPAERRIRGELAILDLAREHYVEALDLLLRGDYWDDAAYVAERVLTADELKNYVDRVWPEPGNRTAVSLRDLLARRLVRAGREGEARAYLLPGRLKRLDAYVDARSLGRDAAREPAVRAAALWRAATMARYEGMELMGTEIEPDWFIHEGTFEQENLSEIRAATTNGYPAAASRGEKARASAHAPEPDQRFHYRYIALDLAWEAAALMPDQSDETARVLCAAGSWVKNRDPKAAERFYKALVRRCGKTALGAQAATLRWFPRMESVPNAGSDGSITQQPGT